MSSEILKRELQRRQLLSTEGTRPRWKDVARPEQLAPEGDWRVWLIQAGRGWGKTRTGAEWVQSLVEEGKAKRIALIGPTAADVRDVMIEGESGLLSIAPPHLRPLYEPSKRRLTWPNGATATAFSADEPERLRGPQSDALWADEPASWRRPEAWDMAMFGLRLGSDPRACVTGTPKPVKLIQQLRALPTTVVTRGRTMDNAANLAPQFLESIVAKYENTRLGRQELEGELLEDVPGALFTWAMFGHDAFRFEYAPPLSRIVIGVDPAASSTEDSDETGIIVAGLGMDGRAYVLADASVRDTPNNWGLAVKAAYEAFRADRVIAERNNGGEMVEYVLRSVAPGIPITTVWASRGKQTRAEPVSALYEQGKVSHVGHLAHLETQMTSWVPNLGKSPDRVDACLVAGTMVLTSEGERPIEQIKPGMLVMTRQGLRRVRRAEMTNPDAEVLTVVTSAGRSLTGTANHPVYVLGKGFVNIDALVWDDRLLPCQTTKSCSTELPSVVTQTRHTGAVGSTTPRIKATNAPWALSNYTAKSGSTIAALSLKAGRFITRTATRLTTISKTLNSSPRDCTQLAMLGSLLTPAARILIAYGTPQSRGTEAQLVEQSTPASGGNHGRGAKAKYESVSSAGMNSRRSSTVPGTVRALASTLKPSGSAATTRHAPALPATTNSASDVQNLSEPAPVLVRGSFVSGRASVYNLEVEDVHEYFANGVLVHNCVWALTELMLDDTHAFGVANLNAW